jgi:putrescine aminotransferase
MNIKTIKSYYKKYVNPGFVDQVELFSFHKDIFLKSKGVFIYTKNKKIFDITGGIGVLNHGHNHPDIMRVRKKYNFNFNLEVHKNILSKHVALLAKMIASFFNNKLNFSYFCNSGAEANEAAIKASYRFHSGERKTILHASNSFHGKLVATGSISSPLKNYKFPNVLRKMEFKVNDFLGFEKIENKYKKNCDVFALIIEPYSASTTTAVNEKFLKKIVSFCKKNKIILIYDEIYTGWCKTGTTFYFQRYKNIYPDILTTSKSLGGGKASIAACVMKKKIFNKIYGSINDATLHSTTFNGFGEECATAIEAIKILKKEKFNQKAKMIEKYINKKFNKLNKNQPSFKMKLKGVGGIQKIYFDLSKKSYELSIKKGFQKKYKNLFLLRKRLFEIALIDTLYLKFNIFAFHSLNSLVISPSLIVQKKQIDYVFLSLEKIFQLEPESIIKNYLKRQDNKN